MADSAIEDRRVQKSRQALTNAFLELVVERPYDEIKIGDIIERADVGRSTFYEHYSNKDDLLRASLDGALVSLANMATKDHDVERLTFWIGNLWDNKRLGRILLGGPARLYLTRALAALIEERLAVDLRRTSRPGAAPIKLAALQMAEAELGLINAWLSGVAACRTEAMVEMLHDGACGIVRALYPPA